ncbi:MAG: HDIG domain-containing protein [Prevotellaceae bacterium]|jgi:putative nucleotidyltransferase with HDIG domain|nr:HDIG domain-containing protein [Prevotellaceae bacterium]
MERQQALNLLLKYNKEKYHIRHALTVEEVLKWYAKEFGYDPDYWGIVGLLHDIDYEMYPDEHCVKSVEILRSENYGEDFIRSVCSHAYGMRVDIKPEHQMEKILFAVDELTGIVGAAALMRPSKSISDMELKSLRKKFNDKIFAAKCSREVIQKGAEMLEWELDKLLSMTLEAMRSSENIVSEQLAALQG